MALALKDRVKETTTTAGTGTVTLAGAAAGFQSFAAVGDGNQTFYAIVDAATGDWEVGVGTYTASGTTLSRTTVVSSSNSGSLVPFAAGTKDVFVTYPASRSVYLDVAGSAVSVLDIGTLGTSTANITTANITAGTVTTTPTTGNDLVNKTYVDTMVSSGLTYHAPVKYEVPNTTGNLTALYNQPGGAGVGVGATLTNNGTKAAFAPDGPTASVGDRVLVYNQTNAFENGIYTVTTVGTPDPGGTNWVLTRATDADTYATKSPNGLGQGDAFFVTSGDTGAGETYELNTVGVITFGTTALTFVQISSAQVYKAGTGLNLSPSTTFNISNVGTAGTYGSASSVPVITTNAQGQVTGVTPTAIAITGAAVSGNISGQAGSVANALTAGTFLTAAGTFDGSAARTFAVDATDANTASKVVARDASGNFSAGTITATLSGSATSATTATNLAGGAANQIPYQTGAGATTFAVAPSASNQVLNWNGSAFTWSAGTISGVALGSNLNTLTFGTYLTGTSYNGSGAVTLATNATNANTASTLVARDASGNFSAGTITAALSGNATTATSATTAGSANALSGINSNISAAVQTGTISSVIAQDTNASLYRYTAQAVATFISGQSMNISGSSTSCSGNAATATALQTARTINGTSFNGTANITITAAANGGNSATAGGFTPSQSAGVANRIVVADAGGYINNNYFNSTDNAITSGVTAVMSKAGDNYYRSASAAAIATFISGQSMNISGTATYLSGSGQINTIVGKNGTTADINAANDTGSFSIRGDASFPASVSFHRTGAYAINMGLSTGNNFVIGGWSASSNAFVMSGAGALTMLNNITAYSDERVKTNWRDLRPDFIERLAEVKHGIYDRTDQVSTQVGVSAQSLQKILEHAVMEGDDGHLSVAYGNAALVAAVKLAERVVALEARIAALEAKG
jgi:hypothetical protein